MCFDLLTRQVLDLDEGDVELLHCSVVDRGVPQSPVGGHGQEVILVLREAAAVAAKSGQSKSRMIQGGVPLDSFGA